MSSTTPPLLRGAAMNTKRTTQLTFMDELHIKFEARLLANKGQVFPISQSVPPSPELIERVRQCFLQQQRDEEESS
jgi:hypothetical protein